MFQVGFMEDLLVSQGSFMCFKKITTLIREWNSSAASFHGCNYRLILIVVYYIVSSEYLRLDTVIQSTKNNITKHFLIAKMVCVSASIHHPFVWYHASIPHRTIPDN